MTSALSKRQQARNETSLQDLVRSVPGNDQCADCHARNPSWASWSLGVFLCMRCAAIHRKLGTHISKVKSLSMDAWSNEQVDNMRKVGNLASNKIYNPENKKPSIPVDADEADSAMERFIRQKYVNNVNSLPSKSKKAQLDEGTPPPLPPKNSKFGFRSASSIFPLSSRSKAKQSAAAQELTSPSWTPGHANKQSKVFGATVDYGQDDNEKKLARLRDMGFQDDQRNAMILKGVNGNLERAVEALIRLGEGDRHSPLPSSGPAERTLRISRSLTPVGTNSAGLSVGLSVPQRAATQDRPTTASATFTNPFDMMPPAQPQTAHSTGTLQNNNPYMNSTNPFGSPSQQTDPMSQAFHDMSLSSAPQPLFPHHTGGVASPQVHQFSMYQQPPPAPAIPSIPQQYRNLGVQSSMTYPQPSAQQFPPQQASYNPFFVQPTNPYQQQHQQQHQYQHQQQQMPQQNLSLNTGQAANFANNPFTRSPTRIASPPLSQIPEQSQSTMFQAPSPLQPQMTANNPFLNNTIQYQGQTAQQPQFFGQQQQYQQPQLQQQQQQQFYQPPRADKAAILALYGQSQVGRPMASELSVQTAPQTIPEDGPMPMQSIQAAQAPVPQSRSVPLVVAGNTNPFMTDRKISRESVNLGMDMAWTNGRHSPDAFASLSARHG